MSVCSIFDLKSALCRGVGLGGLIARTKVEPLVVAKCSARSEGPQKPGSCEMFLCANRRGDGGTAGRLPKATWLCVTNWSANVVKSSMPDAVTARATGGGRVRSHTLGKILLGGAVRARAHACEGWLWTGCGGFSGALSSGGALRVIGIGAISASGLGGPLGLRRRRREAQSLPRKR